MNLDYYIPRSNHVSFHIIGLKYAQALTCMGFEVSIKYLDEAIDPESPVAIIHPLFYLTQNQPGQFLDWLDLLNEKYSFVCGHEVADTTEISSRFANWANHKAIKYLFLPSEFSRMAFAHSGVESKMMIVPHGFCPVESSHKFDFLRDIKSKKALSFVLHESHRKGFDVILSCLAERPDLFFVVKGPSRPDSPLYDIKDNVLIVNHWLSDQDLSSLYQSCDFLFSPHRGGAFELNCLEAAGYGLPVVASGFGAVLEYLPEEATSYIQVNKHSRLWGEEADHCGLGADIEIEFALEALDRMICSFNTFKVNAIAEAENIKRDYSWQAVTQKMSEVIKNYEDY